MSTLCGVALPTLHTMLIVGSNKKLSHLVTNCKSQRYCHFKLQSVVTQLQESSISGHNVIDSHFIYLNM